ncbi:hypothetical protein ACWGJB_39960 [Streptomyces sp. NPDC054813]
MILVGQESSQLGFVVDDQPQAALRDVWSDAALEKADDFPEAFMDIAGVDKRLGDLRGLGAR